MKIRAVRPYVARVGVRNQLILKIESEDGLFGWGEAGLSGREKAVLGELEHYGRLIVGMDARRIGAIWQTLYRSQYFEGGRVLTAAMSAIDIALHDLKAKSLGVPVYELLGGRQRDRVPTFATTSADPGPAMIDHVNLMPHNPLGPICTAASVHMAAAVANFAWLECRHTPTPARPSSSGRRPTSAGAMAASRTGKQARGRRPLELSCQDAGRPGPAGGPGSPAPWRGARGAAPLDYLRKTATE